MARKKRTPPGNTTKERSEKPEGDYLWEAMLRIWPDIFRAYQHFEENKAAAGYCLVL